MVESPWEDSSARPELRRLVLMNADSTENALVEFVQRNAATISQFRVTAPRAVINRIKDCLGENAKHAQATEVNFMGGDAQVATQIVLHDVGAAFIFRDPIGTTAAACDCDALLRLINVHNIMNATNPASAEMLVQVLAEGLSAPTVTAVGSILPSFVSNLESPAVAKYQAKQNAVIAACSASGGATAAPSMRRDSSSVETLQFGNQSELRAALNVQESIDEDAEEEEEEGQATRAAEPAGAKPAGSKLAKLRIAGKLAGKTAVLAASANAHRNERVNQATTMRCLALISHNNMKGAMKEFVLRHQNVLKSFRLTGTNSTMTMLKTVLGTEGVAYGPTCSSGPLGGDAEVGALMCVEDLGGMIFFTDPLDPHPHATDVLALIRMCDLNNLMHASNPTTGDALVRILKKGLDAPELIPTFYTTSLNPAVGWHREDQNGALFDNSSRKVAMSLPDRQWILDRAKSAGKALSVESERGDGKPAGWSPLTVGSVAAAVGFAIAWAIAWALGRTGA